ncbi:MAG: diguanylate cyclase domain-containing protein [Bacillota bacterium]
MNRKVDVSFLLTAIELFVIATMIILNNKFVDITQYLLFGITILIVVIAFYTNLVIALIISLFAVFSYGSYVLYQSLVGKITDFQFERDYFWILAIPITAFTAGKFGEYIHILQNAEKNLEYERTNLVTIDDVTSLHNLKRFCRDLAEEMSRAKRHKHDLVLMIMEIQYFEQLLSLAGQNKVNEILRSMADKIEKVTRDEDKRYRIKRDLFAIVMPNTDIQGAEIVKNRLKDELNKITISKERGLENFHFAYKIGMVPFYEDIKNPLQFKELAERELEYDV